MEMNEIKQKVLEDVDPEIHRLKKKERRKYRALVTVEFVALIAGIMIVFYMLTGISTVQGNSMYPTLHSGDRVIYNRRTADYKAGDVIVLKRPDGEEFVKRIVAVAGDTVNIQNIQCIIPDPGVPVPEPPIADSSTIITRNQIQC